MSKPQPPRAPVFQWLQSKLPSEYPDWAIDKLAESVCEKIGKDKDE